MSVGQSPSRRDLWLHWMIYPGHSLPTAAAPVLVAMALAARDHVFAALPAHDAAHHRFMTASLRGRSIDQLRSEKPYRFGRAAELICVNSTTTSLPRNRRGCRARIGRRRTENPIRPA